MHTTTKNTTKKFTPSSGITFHKLDSLEWLSIGLSLWFLFYPHPYKVSFAIVLSLPIIGLILHGISQPSLASLVTVSNKNGNDNYDVADFIEFPGFAILIRVLIDFEFESFYSLLKVGTVGFVILLLLLRLTHKLIEDSNKNKWVIYFSIVFNILLYSYGATYGINCVYDNSSPQVYQTKVIGKSISHGRNRRTYYLKVEAWGQHHKPENISVASSQYDATQIGQTVSIDYQQGLLGIPWYYIE